MLILINKYKIFFSGKVFISISRELEFISSNEWSNIYWKGTEGNPPISSVKLQIRSSP